MAEVSQGEGKGAAVVEVAPRADIANRVVVGTFWLIGSITAIAIIMAVFHKEAFTLVKDVLGILLPVTSAWVGTVLAYYFSKENFATAAKETRALVDQLSPEDRLRAITAQAAMVPIAQAQTYAQQKDADKVMLKADLIGPVFDAKNVNRLPVLDPDGKVKYVIHRSTMDRFAVREAQKNRGIDVLTLKDLLDDAELGKMVKEGYSTVKPDSNLAHAKMLVETIPNCADIFVTEDGSRNSKALGWITNRAIAEKAKV